MENQKYFGVMLDMSRNAVMKPSEVKNFANILKKMGYNMIQLYTEETYEVDNEPYFGYMRGRYTQAELQDIVAYCESIGVEVIPCIQTLAHLDRIFRWKPYHSINDCGDILLVGDERTYELIENIFSSLRKCFRSEYVHIGMDEAHMLGLGKYLEQHGFKNRFEILNNHLLRVMEIAAKYNFKPMMWSDMFFRLANNGEYYPENPQLTEEVIQMMPKNLGLVYWDYYHTEQEYFEKMMRAHLQAGDNVWFAGGAWVWSGFASGNNLTLDTMLPAMKAAANCGVNNILMTMWGDNGKECSFYSSLPSLFRVRKAYEGVDDMDVIRGEFKEIVGVDYDAMMALDLPNYVGGNQSCLYNVCKHMFYSDPFMGFFDSTIKEEAVEEYKAHSKQLKACEQSAGEYAYLFKNAEALCDFLSIKYNLGLRTRQAYQSGNKAELTALIEDYKQAGMRLTDFYEVFKALWFKENKPHGFDVHDLRMGGLIQRFTHCRQRLIDYMDGKIDKIDELEEELLDWYGNGKEFQKDPPNFNRWEWIASANVI